MAKVLKLQLQYQCFQWIFRTDLLKDERVRSPCSPRDSQEFSLTPQFKSINSLVLSFFMVQISHLYMTTGKTIALTIWNFVSKVMSLLFNTLSRFAIAFLPRSKLLLISWLQSPSAVILEPRKIKPVTVSIFFPCICHEVMGLEVMILVFECWVVSQLFYPFTFLKRLFSSSLLSAVRVVSSAYLRLLIFLDSSLCFFSLAFCMMYYACKINKQGDNI